MTEVIRTDNTDVIANACKKIAELEKENAELEKKVCKLEFALENKTVDYDTLEKENAELKSGCGMCYRKDKEQLTKAKELLKQWLQTSKASGCYNINIVTDTEQFLNSEPQSKWINPARTTNDNEIKIK